MALRAVYACSGRVEEDEGNYTEAARLYEEAKDIFDKLQSPSAQIARGNLERVQRQARRQVVQPEIGKAGAHHYLPISPSCAKIKTDDGSTIP